NGSARGSVGGARISAPHRCWCREPPACGIMPRPRGGSPLVHSVNGFRLHETAMYLESQTHFGDIPGPRKGSAGVFLDSAQAVADGVRVTNENLSRTAHRRIVVQPHPKRFKKYLPVRVGKIAKTVQHSADRLDHHLGRADCSGGKDGAV